MNKWVQLKPEYHTKDKLIANLMDLEDRLLVKYQRTLKREQMEAQKAQKDKEDK